MSDAKEAATGIGILAAMGFLLGLAFWAYGYTPREATEQVFNVLLGLVCGCPTALACLMLTGVVMAGALVSRFGEFRATYRPHR